MLKTKPRRFAIVAVVVFSLLAMYGGMPAVNAASMDSAKVTLGDSDLNTITDVTIAFDLGTALNAGEYVNVNFPAEFSGLLVGNVVCPDGGVAGVSGQNVTCTGALAADVVKSITISGVTTPNAADDYSIIVSSHQAGGAVIESSETKVYIIDDVTVTAHVAASLTFSVTGVATTTAVNGDATTGSTSPTEIAFKTLEVGVEQRMAQQLSVATNADGGYSVTVQQDGNMNSAAGADIDSFNTGGPIDWAAPAGTLGAESTYGHMGLASNDADLATPFAAGFYRGLDGTTPLEIMSHNGPSNGIAANSGLASVIYNIQITALQEAGDYDNVLTYVCTPTY